MIKKRSIGLAVFLCIVTLGIYPFVMMCIMGKEVNRICEGDGKKQMHFLLAVLLGLVTLFIYPVVWCSKAMNRLCDNAYRYGPTVHPANSGGSYVLWIYLGSFIAVGPIVAFCKFMDDVNAFAGVYGYVQPLQYTDNQLERVYLAEHNDLTPKSITDAVDNISIYDDIPKSYAIPRGGDVPTTESLSAALMAENVNIHNNAGSAIQPIQNVDSVPPTLNVPGFTPGRGCIKGISGMYSGFEFPMLDNETMVIGKNPQFSNIVIDINGSFVSAKHCSVRYNALSNYYDVTDFSTNGTYTNDNMRIQKNTTKRLLPGTEIYLGNRENGFRLG